MSLDLLILLVLAFIALGLECYFDHQRQIEGERKVWQMLIDRMKR